VSEVIAIYDKEGVMIDVLMPQPLRISASPQALDVPPPVPLMSSISTSRQVEIVEPVPTIIEQEEESGSTLGESVEMEERVADQLASVGTAGYNPRLPYLGLALVLLLGTLAVYLTPRGNQVG
jgi:hypothetical protein